MPRILILHASVGSGHEHAARALADAFEQVSDCETRVEDTLAFATAPFRRAYAQSYLDVVARAPGLWQRYFEATDRSDSERIATDNRSRGQLEVPLLARLDRLVDEFAPSVIVCTHFLPAEVLVHRRRVGRFTSAIYTVVTDYVAHSFWQTPGVDGYFVAGEIPRDLLLARGVSASAIRVCGIPVGGEIATSKVVADVRARRGWSVDRPLIAILGGGMPVAHVRQMAQGLLQFEEPATLVVVAGRSAELPRALADLTNGPHVGLRVLGSIDYVDDLVAASDLAITKAGGLIVSEILARGTPLIVVDPIPGQEEWNADYVVSVGAGVQLRRVELAPYAVRRILSEPSRLADMRERARGAGRPRAALDIAETVLSEMRSRPIRDGANAHAEPNH